MESEILISVVIPVKNGDAWLRETIPSILEQRIDGNIEIIAVDSGSTDQTLAILDSFPVNIIHIKPEEFNHGLSRNLGAGNARGKFVVMTVQDARPMSSLWLQELLNGFVDDSVAGVSGRQVVTHDLNKNPVEWYRPISKPEMRRVQFLSAKDFEMLSPVEKLAVCRWDDVNAMYRKDVLKKIPFKKTDFAEDALWAKDALLGGYSIVYNPIAQVAHYHLENYEYVYKRNFIQQYHFFKYFDVLPEQNNMFFRFLGVIRLLLKEKGISIPAKIKWLKYNFDSFRAIHNSNKVIVQAVLRGGSGELDKIYNISGDRIPQAIKKNL